MTDDVQQLPDGVPGEALPEISPGLSADRPLAPGLYLVATPIGNLEDITLRALRVLRSADRIACEDTRQTGKLLNHYGIRKPLVSYHLHNEGERTAELVGDLRSGARIAVVSDAGMPGIADPGEPLVRAAAAAGIAVFAVPGANAVLSALTVSGLSTERFHFDGFLPSKEGQRRTRLEQLRARMLADTGHGGETTLIVYETPHRILGTLDEVAAVFGPDHRVALARELTKLHEEVLRGTVGEVRDQLGARPAVRGEMVLLLSGRGPGRPLAAEATMAEPTLTEAVAAAMREGLPEKDALKRVAKARGLGKSEAYREWQRGRVR